MAINIIDIPGYVYVGLNRDTQTVKNGKGPGGVGILVNHSILEEFRMKVCARINDSVLGIKLNGITDDYCMVFFCVYLPPESSKYGKQNENTLDKLTIEIYRQTESDRLFICGDFNARIADKQDCQWIDDAPPRTNLDEGINQQGNQLLTFVNNIKGCIVNSRVTKELDDYTSVTAHKGKSVVDYHIVRQSDIDSIKEMQVCDILDVIDTLSIQDLIYDGSKPPNHNLLCMKVELKH